MPECEECGRVQPIQDDPNGELCDGCYEDRYLSGPTPEQQEAS